MKKTIIGFLVAPLFGPFLIGFFIATTDDSIQAGNVMFWFLTFFIGIPAAYLYAAVIGVPIHLILVHFKKNNWQYYTIVIGLSPVLSILPVFFAGEFEEGFKAILLLILFSPVCALIGYIFWFISVRNRSEDLLIQ